MGQYTIRFSKAARVWVIDASFGVPVRNSKGYIIDFSSELAAQDHCDAMNTGEITVR